MRIAEPSVELIAYTQLPPETAEPDVCSDMARVVERAGRVSWKSEDKMGPGTADGFMTRVVNIKKDESIAEHASVTMLFVTDRYASHQLVRHRLAAYTQESTHYINYGKTEKGGEIVVMRPLGIPQSSEAFNVWRHTCERAEAAYMGMLDMGVKHYHARFVLPGCLKTEVVATYNLRMWRHVVAQRIAPNNTPEIVKCMQLALPILFRLCPPMFEDLAKKEGLLK
jgi:thymidylate synthase (FAD)